MEACDGAANPGGAILLFHVVISQIDSDFYHSFYYSSKTFAIALFPLCPQISHLEKNQKVLI